MKWSMFAGGTGAASGKHGYAAVGSFGEYMIQPVSTQYGRHKGYQEYFINNKGKLPGGLYQSLGLFRSPNEAKGAAIRHYQKHFASPIHKKRRP